MEHHLGSRNRRLVLMGILGLMALLLGAGWAGAMADDAQQMMPTWGPDVRANSDNSGWSQHEPHLAISRTDSDVVVVVAKDYRVANTKEVWIYVSQDGGQTWPLDKQLQVPGLPPGIDEQSDPVVMARDDGRLYVVCLGVGNSSGSHGLFLTWSDDNGDTWQDAVNITYNETLGSLDDKEWLAIDNSLTSPHYHNMYVAWSDPYGEGVLFKRSLDGGLTWSSYVNIDPGAFTEYAYPVVAADGDLYLFYMDGWGYCQDGDIKYVRSPDGGTTFDPPVTVTATSQPCSPIHGTAGYDQWRFFSIITAAADPNDADNLWVAWTDDNNVPYGKTDVLYVRSSDGGATWSASERLSHDDPSADVDHITPVFAIGPDSRLHAFWLDRRDDPSNILFLGYHTSTADGGDTWELDSRVSDEAFDLNVGFPPPPGYNAAGDYWGLDVVGSGQDQIVMAAWNTTVLGEQDIYISRGVFSDTIITLTGQVSDAQTLAPLWGAAVTAAGTTTTTDAGGLYTLTLPLPGWYTVTASLNGYLPQSIQVAATGSLVIQDFSLVPLVCPEPAILAVNVVTDDLTAAFSATITTTLPAGYLWDFGDGITSTLPAPTHTYPAYGTYPYTLTVTNACGDDDWSGQVILPAPRQRVYLPLIVKNWP